MKNLITIFVLMFTAACNTAQTNYVLSAIDFKTKMETASGAQLLDVRTPEEFADGHLANALNYDWNGTEFEKQISTLDKNKPVFVYCLSGKRSAAAATKMRSEGFTAVYELDGGIMKWRAANLPEVKNENATSNDGMTQQEFDQLLNTDKTVIVDFNAVWCGPCQKLKPILEEIEKENPDKYSLVSIDADHNLTLVKAMKVDAIPALFVYKNHKLVWQYVGFISKEELLKHLN